MDDPRRRPALKAWQRRILVRLAAEARHLGFGKVEIDEIKQFPARARGRQRRDHLPQEFLP